MFKHKINFNHAPRKANSVGANCECGWSAFTNTSVHGGLTKAKTSLRDQHNRTKVGA